jgi:hypothetical protein
MVASALATIYSDTGTVFRSGSHVGAGVSVQIWNQTTGARGSTNTNSAGQWSFGGVVGGNNYSFIVKECINHHEWYGNTNLIPQPSNNVNGINVTESLDGFSC